MGMKICIICGRQYESITDKQIYCSANCASIRKPILKLTCKNCGKTFYTQRKRSYCSNVCLKKDSDEKEKEKRQNKYKEKELICKWCGKKFIKHYNDKRDHFCSKDCSKEFKHYTERKTIKNKDRIKKHNIIRSRIINKNAIDRVTYESVYKRDKGICKICGMSVSTNKCINNNWGGTIDHIIPLTLGGKHSMGNCQLTHNICNAMKLQEKDEFKLDWIKKAKDNLRWKKKLEQYVNDMLMSGELKLVNSVLFYYSNINKNRG